MDKLTAEEILFKYHTHGDMIFPDIEDLQGDCTIIYTHESALAAMEAYKNQSSVSDEEDLEPSKEQDSKPVASHSSGVGNSIEQ